MEVIILGWNIIWAEPRFLVPPLLIINTSKHIHKVRFLKSCSIMLLGSSNWMILKNWPHLMIFCMLQRPTLNKQKKFILGTGPEPRYTHFSVWMLILPVWIWFKVFNDTFFNFVTVFLLLRLGRETRASYDQWLFLQPATHCWVFDFCSLEIPIPVCFPYKYGWHVDCSMVFLASEVYYLNE